MANRYAQLNGAFPNAFFWQDNGANNDGAANHGLVHPNPGQQHDNHNGDPANDDASPEIQEVNGPTNAPPANHGQEQEFEEKMVTITPRVMRMWADGQSSTRISNPGSPAHVALAPRSARAVGGGEEIGTAQAVAGIERGREAAGNQQHVVGGG
ncbi:hypothetical protein BDR05DRAFT_953205 [Suillus weaverae]|nr:hypothetical protein BDR05DRAFT_953205 [Suillus weaverae]